MRVFVNRTFRRFVDDQCIMESSLCNAVREIASGLAHANLGGGVYKQRIAREGAGKSGGFRTIVFFKAETCAYFITGFAKNSKGNLSRNEVSGLKDLARRILVYDGEAIEKSLRTGALEEVDCKQALP